MNQHLAHANPIHTGRGDEAERRKAAGITGDALTTQFITNTAPAIPAITITPAPVAPTDVPVQSAIAQAMTEVTAPAAEPVVVRNEYLDNEQFVDVQLTDTVTLGVTLYTVYEHTLKLDFTVLPDVVVCAFINADGEIVAATSIPSWDEELLDYVLDDGQYMILGNVPVGTKHTYGITLTMRGESPVVEPVNQLIDVNATAKPTPVEEKPYYWAWGEKRRKKERQKIRRNGGEVPADL